MKSIQIVKPTPPECRGAQHHIASKNRILDHKYCLNCKAQVLLTADKHCQCCGSKWNFKHKKSKRSMQNVLNHFMDSYQELIEWWCENPQAHPIFLEQHHGNWVYQIEIRWLAKYYCLAEIDATLLPTPELSPDEYVKFCRKKVQRVIFTHDNKVGKTERISDRFTEFDKVQVTLDLIKPHLRKVDLQITWGKERVTTHQD